MSDGVARCKLHVPPQEGTYDPSHFQQGCAGLGGEVSGTGYGVQDVQGHDEVYGQGEYYNIPYGVRIYIYLCERERFEVLIVRLTGSSILLPKQDVIERVLKKEGGEACDGWGATECHEQGEGCWKKVS